MEEMNFFDFLSCLANEASEVEAKKSKNNDDEKISNVLTELVNSLDKALAEEKKETTKKNDSIGSIFTAPNFNNAKEDNNKRYNIYKNLIASGVSEEEAKRISEGVSLKPSIDYKEIFKTIMSSLSEEDIVTIQVFLTMYKDGYINDLRAFKFPKGLSLVINNIPYDIVLDFFVALERTKIKGREFIAPAKNGGATYAFQREANYSSEAVKAFIELL